jgi:hypothetical protein
MHNSAMRCQVMLFDLQATAAGPAVTSSVGQLYPTEADFLKSSAAYADDALWVAPAGDAAGRAAYPAALSASSSSRLLSVGAVDCAGRRWPAGSSAPADLLAPGADVAGVAANGDNPASTLTLDGGGGELSLTTLSAGDARARPAADVRIVGCYQNGACPEGGRPLCVLPVTGDAAGRAACDAFAAGRCGGGVALIPAGSAALPPADALRLLVDGCAPSYGAGVASGGRPPVVMADPAVGARLAALVGAGAKPAGKLLVSPPAEAVRSGTPEAAAFVAGGAARLMARYPVCGASDVAAALVDTAALLGPDGAPTGARGRGGLLQLRDADKALGQRPCAQLKLKAAVPGSSQAG